MKIVPFMLLYCVISIMLSASVLEVSLSGSYPYTSIQSAINDAISGDVVLVYPGRYIENIDLSNKSGISLCSLEQTTGDTSYISSTIIDGSANANSTILCYENVFDVTIRGLSITGGRGYIYSTGPYALEFRIFGGGIFIKTFCSVNLINLEIYGNRAGMGGGVNIGDANIVSLSNVNIYNNIARYTGGGLSIGSSPQNGAPTISFSQADRCSIYNNFSHWGMDIHWHYIHGGTVDVYLKKFTVPTYERYYADHYDAGYDTSPYSVFEIQEAYLNLVNADIYVSPMGNDSADGLSPSTAIKTPSLGIQRIGSNSAHRRTVHLLDGVHHNQILGEYMPISIKDYTILKGESESGTKLYAENLIRGTGVISLGIVRYGMEVRDLSISTSMSTAIFGWEMYDSHFENLNISDCTVNHWIVNIGYINSTFTMKNITLSNNVANHFDFGLNLTGAVMKLDKIVIRDSGVPWLPTYWHQRGCGGFDIAVRDSLIISNSKFINNTHYSEDGFANFRTNSGPWYTALIRFENCLFANNRSYGGVRDIDIFGGHPGEFLNCTFSNNIGTYPDFLRSGTTENRLVNCIFSNNSNTYDMRVTNDTIIENCLFSKSTNMYRTYDGESLNWGTGNQTGTNPLFVGGNPASIGYYYLCADEVNGYSPAIDAGTINPFVFPEDYVIPLYDAFGNDRVFGMGIDIGCYESPGYTGIEDNLLPSVPCLELSNYPNPFNPSTTISLRLPSTANIELVIYNARGQKIKTLCKTKLNQGQHRFHWDGKDEMGKQISSGIYFCKTEYQGKAQAHKMLLLK